MQMYQDQDQVQERRTTQSTGFFSGLASTVSSVTSIFTPETTTTRRAVQPVYRPPSPVLRTLSSMLVSPVLCSPIYHRQVVLNINYRLLEERLPELNRLFAEACAASPGSPDDAEYRRRILLKIIEILIEIGCLVPSPAQPYFEAVAFGYGVLKLSEQTGNMVKRVQNGENVFEFNQQNVTEWLEIVSKSAGLASFASTKIIVKYIRNGETKEALRFIATVLDYMSLGCDSGSIVIQRFGEEYNKMDPLEQRLEDVCLIIHLYKLFAALK